MEFRQLANSGLKVSITGLGCNNFGPRLDPETSTDVVNAAIDAGVNFFDTAPMYGNGQSEEILGKALGKRRDQVLIATKFGAAPGQAENGSRSFILNSVEQSLRRLQTDHIDLLQLHFPDPNTPIRETLATLTNLIEQGKVRYIGCSWFTGWMIADSSWISKVNGYEPFITVQNEWSLIARGIETEVVEAARRFSMSILPFYPLHSGLLTGKHRRGAEPDEKSRMARPQYAHVLSDENFTKVEILTKWAESHGYTMTELALSWLASQPIVGSVIAGATSVEQVQMNVASTHTNFSPDEIKEIGELFNS